MRGESIRSYFETLRPEIMLEKDAYAKSVKINRNSAGQSVLSIMKSLSALGIIKYQHGESKNVSVVKRDTELTSVRTAKSGIFEPLVRAGDDVSEGTPYDRKNRPLYGKTY